MVTENLRAKSQQMIALNASLEAKDFNTAFEILAPDTVTVARGEVAQTAARIWANLDKSERDQTLPHYPLQAEFTCDLPPELAACFKQWQNAGAA